MHLIMDYSWNHTGVTFWAWEELKRNQTQSRFRDWFDITAFDDPNTPQDEFAYEGWLGVKTLCTCQAGIGPLWSGRNRPKSAFRKGQVWDQGGQGCQ